MERWRGDDDPDEDDSFDEEEGDLDEGAWELDPNDPSHPDHDLSESAGYAYWEQPEKPWYMRRGIILLLTVLVIFGLLYPVLARLT